MTHGHRIASDSIEGATGSIYSDVRALLGDDRRMTVVYVTDDQLAIAVGVASEPLALHVSSISAKTLARHSPERLPLQAIDIEYAIAAVEDAISPLQTLHTPNAPLYTTHSSLSEITRLAGIEIAAILTLTIEVIEDTFDRVVVRPTRSLLTSSGTPQHYLQLARRLIIFRELMHHLRAPYVTSFGELTPEAKG